VAADALVRRARQAGVTDARVLQALRDVPRAMFVPAHYAHDAWLDEPFSIGHHQTTSQPSLIALMIEALELSPTDTVLEVGTGLGYEAALLARLAAQVLTVERVPELAEAAGERLRAAGVTNVEVVSGDGSLGLPEKAPFDAIIAAATADRIPLAFGEQLAEGGRLVLPLRRGLGEAVEVYRRSEGSLRRTKHLCSVRFVPLIVS
jgi:protein-L-isoaspartate(D-aspartate) O-methyltransferase